MKVKPAWTKMECSAGHHELNNGQLLRPQAYSSEVERRESGRAHA